MLGEHWVDDWLDVIRDVIFPDATLREYMMLPANISIIDFIENYFIPATNVTSELLTNEDVRIVYGAYPEGSTNIPNAHHMTMSFDIFVRKEHLYDVDYEDALVQRTQRIARRLLQLLYYEPIRKNDGFIGVYNFKDPRENPMGTKTVGYERYNLSLSFIQYY